MRSIPSLTCAALVGALLISGAAAAETVSANWQKHCVTCHGVDGKGKTKMGQRLKITDLTDAARQAEFTDADAVNAVKHGIKDANGKTTMKAVEGLSEAEIDELVAFVRTLAKP